MSDVDPQNSYGTPEGPEAVTPGQATEPTADDATDAIDGGAAANVSSASGAVETDED